MSITSHIPHPTFSIVSLGCFRNTYDSEVTAQRFSDQGYIFKPDIKTGSDLLIINTCGFIDKAKEESLEAIKAALDLKKKKKIRKILVFGCLVKRYEKELKKYFPQVDEWRCIENFGPYFVKRKSLSSGFSDFLKISEGCINGCSFCAIPAIKGPLISRPADEVIKEAKYLDRKGVKELNIIGQDITGWGKDLKNNQNLTYLLKRILKEVKIKWIRLIYTHPKNFSNSLIELIANEERICKYIDLPIQHISDRILGIMNRGISRKKTIELIRKIRKKIPNCVIRSSVITGFPTETEEESKELLSFLKSIRFERLGAFVYSREKETQAYNLKPQIHSGTKKRRFKEIMLAQKEIAHQLNSVFVEQNLEILVESKAGDTFIGRSQYDAPLVDGIVFIKKKGLKIGQFYKAKIIDAYDYDLVGI
ncbi:MAG: 30S ribosomal protein S12 methylthiotransferase RimO [Candidatus Omnitrophota bacterium]